MRSLMTLFITLGVLLSFTHAKESFNVKRAKFNSLNAKRALIGDILNFQGGDLISLFGSRYDLGSSYGQRNNNDYVINSHNNESPSKDPDFPFDGFFDDQDFLDDPNLPGDDGEVIGTDSDFLDDPDFSGEGEFVGGQGFRELNNEDEDENDEFEEDEDDNCEDSDLFDETT